MANISEEEKLRRRQSNADVLGTHAMEGIFPDEATSSLLARFADGELTRKQLSAALDRHAETLLALRRAAAVDATPTVVGAA